MRQKAFSLVELSIVLVILGLLVGGILAGQSLIQAAELRSVATKQDQFRTAIAAFRDRYFALPGDMSNATSVWGDQATGTSSCASAATADGTPGTCNGNGDGYLGSTGNQDPEGYRGWQQLALAGLISGSYTGYINGAGVPGVNLPASKVGKGSGYMLLYRQGGAYTIYGYSGNFIKLGTSLYSDMFGEVLTGEDTWNIDTKTDDGRPATGRLMGQSVDSDTNCATTHTNDPSINPSYTLSSSVIGCGLWFKV